MTKNYVSTEVIASLLGCTNSHVALLCRQGKLDAIKPLGRWLVNKNQPLISQLIGIEEEEEMGDTENGTGTDNKGIDI